MWVADPAKVDDVRPRAPWAVVTHLIVSSYGGTVTPMIPIPARVPGPRREAPHNFLVSKSRPTSVMGFRRVMVRTAVIG